MPYRTFDEVYSLIKNRLQDENMKEMTLTREYLQLLVKGFQNQTQNASRKPLEGRGDV